LFSSRKCAPLGNKSADSPDTSERVLFAVASKNGMVVDQHFGHAAGFYIYEYKNRQVNFVERREVSQYCFGPDHCGRDPENTIESIIKTIEGCSGVIVMRIGEVPRQRLAEKGIAVFMTYNYITDAVREAAEKELSNVNCGG
jgi:nitrogen fixation protein NifB